MGRKKASQRFGSIKKGKRYWNGNAISTLNYSHLKGNKTENETSL